MEKLRIRVRRPSNPNLQTRDRERIRVQEDFDLWTFFWWRVLITLDNDSSGASNSDIAS